eukprot:14918035-Alexandrium_andersonii.AAC.1
MPSTPGADLPAALMACSTHSPSHPGHPGGRVPPWPRSACIQAWRRDSPDCGMSHGPKTCSQYLQRALSISTGE